MKILYNKENWERSEKYNETEIIMCADCKKEIQDKRPFTYLIFWTPKNDYFLHLHSKCAYTEEAHSQYYGLNDFNFNFAIIGGFS
ncbi:hypothetical protein LCGC14_1429010 [marine sediment metagenome]|uniref:Uncharacterized protein n=1 Tax=marine sediment metagenome TaxID=412755 RepID=A0A0F9M4K1_9ZZZZ